MNSSPSPRANLQLPAGIHGELKIAAAIHGIPMSAIAAEAISRELARLRRQVPRRNEWPDIQTDDHD